MAFLKKSFLVRRRIDHWVLGAASAAMPIRLGLGPIILFVFSCIGIYLSLARHAATRLFAKRFYIFILLYAAWSIGLILFRGEPFSNNRQIGYTLLIAVFAFAAPGMLLVRNPLRAYVLGARVGIVMAVFAVLYLVLTQGGRIGVGGNEAVFAFVAGVSAISAVIPILKAPRYLPNGPHWLILGLVAVLASETRAVIVVLPIFATIEVILFLKRFSVRQQGAAYAAVVAALAALVIVGPVGDIISKRFAGMVEYYDSGDSSQWEDKISADIREVMWTNAAIVIKQNPIAGVGSYAKMDVIRTQAGDQASMLEGFRHVHNTILDELLNDGIIGLFFMFAAFLSIFVHLWRNSDSWGMRRALIYFAVVSGSYGMLHNPLLHEVTISSVMFFIAALNAASSRRIMALRRAGLSNYIRGN
ncbi:polymerase [Ochrobactrum sp. MYb15]|uniref:O-antigen ligase family protein n=2 Tax=Brucella TaxID=234 RepID=UPI0004654B9E|nr:O-antigen ligase family protein [Brucella rhizosphaerae]PQZ49500.1 polymerase [Ochrobactrum sp. MYb19]PRA57278.1 polymerase [Ochrobactrum sp. MYb68]PRA66682.1 polymerase [Ochrobactrum sp. MYb18]PRA76289.1 polymerase [Brucella thiophenivorans]PRA91692.1 polymerase [Ochrobactrum sp. MYb14]PRA98295.1 polymerase [Ochrobactrum sp. MYb15]